MRELIMTNYRPLSITEVYSARQILQANGAAPVQCADKLKRDIALYDSKRVPTAGVHVVDTSPPYLSDVHPPH